MDVTSVRNAFQLRTKSSSEFEDGYQELCRRTEDWLDVEPGGDWGSSKRIRQYSLALRQVLLHRATRLFSGALTSLSEDNPYSMTLSIRGHFETTAALGYLCHRLKSLVDGNLEAKVVDHDICVLLLGSRDKQILEIAVQMEVPMEAKNVLKLLEYADRAVSKHLLRGNQKEHLILTESYEFLCEFSHPNFHSNAAAFELKRDECRFYFRHSKGLSDKYFGLINYLMISNPIFLELFDMIPEMLPHNGQA